MESYSEEFLHGEGLAPVVHSQPVEPGAIGRYWGILPEHLLAYWQEYGFCGYADGLFWTVNPPDFEDLVQAWLEESPLWGRENYYVIAGTAFGKLYFDGKTKRSVDFLDAKENLMFQLALKEVAAPQSSLGGV